MGGKAFDWNVVVVGAWNVAILTPDGITRRLFKQGPGTPVEVQVAIDRPGPIRVTYSKITVVPSSGRLVVIPVDAGSIGLREACVIASRAIESLPETPLIAVGVNVRYRFEPISDELQGLLGSTLDDRLADGDQRTLARELKRAVVWKDGVLNIELHENEDTSGLVVLNYHRESTNANELRDWLGQSEKMVEHASKVLESVLKVIVEEPGHD